MPSKGKNKSLTPNQKQVIGQAIKLVCELAYAVSLIKALNELYEDLLTIEGKGLNYTPVPLERSLTVIEWKK